MTNKSEKIKQDKTQSRIQKCAKSKQEKPQAATTIMNPLYERVLLMI